jgi:hypothetical protein
MSNVVCPHCGVTVHVFGRRWESETAHLIESNLLGHFPSIPVLPCDAGEIEDYHSDDFEVVVEKVLQYLTVVAE